MQLQKQFVAAHAARIADKNAIAGAARQTYSKPHAKRIIAELATATNERALALIFNVSTWAASKGIGIDAEMLFADEADLAAARGEVLLHPVYEAAPRGATRRQMARLQANFAALGVRPAESLGIVKYLDRREFVQAAQSWADLTKGVVGKMVAWTDAELRRVGIERAANPIADEAGDCDPATEYRIATPTLEAVEPWLHRPCANCGESTGNGSICEPCETMFADEAEARAERELDFRAA